MKDSHNIFYDFIGIRNHNKYTYEDVLIENIFRLTFLQGKKKNLESHDPEKWNISISRGSMRVLEEHVAKSSSSVDELKDDLQLEQRL